MLVQIG